MASVTIKAAAVQKFIDTVPKTAKYRPARQVLKKSLVNYQKETDPKAKANLATSILRGVEALKRRMA